MVTCNFCSKQYIGSTCKINLKNHIIHCKNNPDYIPYECLLCNTKFSRSRQLNIHNRYCGKLKKIKTVKIKTHCDLILRECKYCTYQTYNPYKIGSHTTNCKNNPDYQRILNSRIESGKIPRKHTDESKSKISAARRKFLLENPDKVPYLLNHSSKESYPEKYFSELFEKEGIDVERYFRVSSYELDFSIPEKRICIEIDGEQHYSDPKIIESDKRRKVFLERLGWDLIRIRWSDYKKLNFDYRTKFISDLKSEILKLTELKHH